MKISIVLAALTGNFETDMNRASKTAQKRMKEIQKTAAQVGKAVGAAFVIAAGAVAYGVKTAIDRMDSLAKSAQKVGITTEAFSKLAYAAELSGVEFDQLEGALAKLAKTQDMAAQGGKEQLEYFRALGIEFANADGTLRDTDEVLTDLADKFQKLPDGAGKTAAAMALLGRSGAQLIPLLNGGSSGLAEMGDELARFGGVVGPEAAKQAEQFNDDLTRLRVAVDGVWLGIARNLLPDLINLTGALKDGDDKGDGFRETADKISAAIATVAETAYVAYNRIEALTNATVQLGAKAAQAVLSNPFSGAGAIDMLFNDGAGAREAGILAESSAIRVAEANARADAGLGLGLGTDKPLVTDLGAEAAAADAEAKATAARLEAIRKEQEKLTAARKADADAARAQAEADRELQKIMDAGRAAAEGLTETIQQRAADLAGPAAQAARAYADEMVRLAGEEEKLRAANLLLADTERELALARQLAAESYQQQLDAIEEQQNGPVRQMLDDLKFELELLGMTNIEREKAIALRWANVDAASEEGKAIAAALDGIKEAQDQIAGQDFFRDQMKGLFTDVVSGAKIGREAIDDLFDTLRKRAIEALAERLMDQLFGQSGSTDGGAAGAGWASWIGAIFGGARAAGGPMDAGKAYWVGEKGPELVVPSAAGTVISAGKSAQLARGSSRGGDTFVIQGATSPRSIERIRIDRDRAQRRAVREMV